MQRGNSVEKLTWINLPSPSSSGWVFKNILHWFIIGTCTYHVWQMSVCAICRVNSLHCNINFIFSFFFVKHTHTHTKESGLNVNHTKCLFRCMYFIWWYDSLLLIQAIMNMMLCYRLHTHHINNKMNIT